jgi:hypothetical protein
MWTLSLRHGFSRMKYRDVTAVYHIHDIPSIVCFAYVYLMFVLGNP